MPSKRDLPNALGKFISYILGRRPDEFGLVPDPEGYVKIKELLKAVTEEDGWRYVKRAHLNEVMLTSRKKTIEIDDNRIRAVDRRRLPDRRVADDPPKLLYTFVRSRAYPVVLENGVRPFGRSMVVLSAGKEMAKRLGKRVDAAPVILTVSVEQMHAHGEMFLTIGGGLFLTRFIPQTCFTGPPLPKEKADKRTKEPQTSVAAPKQPGSFFPNFEDDPHPHGKTAKKAKRKKSADWKKDRKKMIKQKRKTGLPF